MKNGAMISCLQWCRSSWGLGGLFAIFSCFYPFRFELCGGWN